MITPKCPICGECEWESISLDHAELSIENRGRVIGLIACKGCGFLRVDCFTANLICKGD